MILLGPLLVIWAFSVRLRCSDAVIRRYITAIALLLILWLVEVLVKYSTPNDPSNPNDLLISMYWYAFYIPMVFVPTLCLFISFRAGALDHRLAVRRLKRMIVVINCLLISLVLTNNAHHFVFVFDFNDPAWGGSYAYAWGYWTVFAWIASLFTAFLGVLLIAARRSLRIAFAPVLLVACMGFSYAFLYALRIVGMQTNLALVFSLIVLIGLELCLDFGLLPSYVWHKEALRKLPINLKILNLDHQVKFSTDCASAPSSTVSSSQEYISPPHDRPFDAGRPDRKRQEPTLITKSFAIPGGSVLLVKDISSIIERRRRLELQQNVLRRRNLMIERSCATRSRLYRQEAERELFAQAHRSLISTTGAIRDILDKLPEGRDDQSNRQRRDQLTRVKLLVAHCKRKGSLLFDEKRDPDFNRQRLHLIAGEISADLRAIGVECSIFVETDAALPTATTTVLHDCVHGVGTAAFFCENSLLAIYIHDRDVSSVEMNAVLQTGAKKAAFTKTIDALRTSLEQQDVIFRLTTSEDSVRLTVVASRREKQWTS